MRSRCLPTTRSSRRWSSSISIPLCSTSLIPTAQRAWKLPEPHGLVSAPACDDSNRAVEAGDVDLGELVTALAAHGIVPRVDDAVTFATRHQVLLMKHEQTEVPIVQKTS